MKDVDLSTFIAVFEEMYGFWLFWGLAAAAALLTVVFLWTLLRERGLRSGRLVWAELVAVAGGVAAVLFVQAITNSGFRDIGGPIDAIVILGIWAAGAVATIMAAYVAQGLLFRGRRTG